jgi:hypothetical protein
MIKANTTIRVGGRVYTEGQTVTGLSGTDTAWMLKAGYITEEKEARPRKAEKRQEAAETSETAVQGDDGL